MAGKGSEQTQFKPGHPGGPGRPRESVTIADLKKKDRESVYRAFSSALNNHPAVLKKTLNEVEKEIKKLEAESDLTALEVAAIRFAHRAVNGDHAKMGFMLDRMIGKPQENLDIKHEHTGSIRYTKRADD